MKKNNINSLKLSKHRTGFETLSANIPLGETRDVFRADCARSFVLMVYIRDMTTMPNPSVPWITNVSVLSAKKMIISV